MRTYFIACCVAGSVLASTGAARALEVKDMGNTLAYLMNGSTRVAEIKFSYSWYVTCYIGATGGSSSTAYNSKQQAISAAMSRCKTR